MRILAFSDVYKWGAYERLMARAKPDVVVLSGDLTSDGGAAFWHEGLEWLPGFRKERHALYERVKKIKKRKGSGKQCLVCRDGPSPPYKECHLSRHADFMFHDHVRQLKRYFCKSKEFRVMHRRLHANKFYSFLKCAGKHATVFVIKGDHDDDFVGAYDADRINKIPGCQEISGSAHEFRGEFFLGVSYQFTAYRRTAQSLLAQFPQRGGIVIAHARQRNVHLLAELRPKLIIRGHYDCGIRHICGVPAVFTAGGHAIVDIGRDGHAHITQPGPREGGHIVRTPAPYDVEPGQGGA